MTELERFMEGDGSTPLMRAIHAKCAEEVEALLAAGAEPEGQLGDGTTPLVTAARGGAADVVTLLLDWGADPRRGDREGRTPLAGAAWGGHLAVIDVLLARGAVVDEPDPRRFSPLRVALTRGRSPAVERLLRAGANPNEVAPGTGGITALIFAASQGYASVVRLLLQAGADPNARDENGRTALILASARGHRRCTQLLLAHGADPAVAATDGKKPIRYVPLARISRERRVTAREWPPIMMWVRWAFTRRRGLHGLQVGVWGQDGQRTTAAFQKVSDALALLARYDRRVLERMRREMPRILVAPLTDGFALFKPSLKMYILAADHLLDPATPATSIASYLVHTATYVRLRRLGFAYGDQERPRIEHVCVKQTVALASRIPGAGMPPDNLAGRLGAQSLNK